MRILLTGSAGFIGRNIQSSLKDKHQIVTFDIKESPLEDVTDFETVYNAAYGCSAISHQAAWVLVEHGLDYPLRENMINVGGTINVLQTAFKRGIGKVVVASSVAAQGSWWTYGVTKSCVEEYCDWFSKYRGLNVACLRYAIVYGRGEWFGRVLTRFIKSALEDEPLLIFGSGKQYRDWIHVDDVITAHNMALERTDLKGTFEVGCGETHTIEEVARLVKEITNSKSEIIYAKNLTEGSVLEKGEKTWITDIRTSHMRLPYELEGFKCDKNKFIPGWTPTLPLAEGIEKVVAEIRAGSIYDFYKWQSV